MPINPEEQYRIVKEQLINFQATLNERENIAICVGDFGVMTLKEVEYAGNGIIVFRGLEFGGDLTVVFQNLSCLSIHLRPTPTKAEGKIEVEFRS